MRRATLLLLPLMGLFSTGFAGAQLSVSSLNDPGSPVYSVQIPVENGYIDVSNGNLHLEFPLVAPKQRGAVSLNEKVVYDSRIWMFSPFGSYGSYHWWPYNVYGGSTSSGGWRLVTSANPGSMSVSGSIYTWTDPTGISHTFDPSSGWAADGSGYSITFGIGPNGYIVKDSAGAMVWPYVADQYGNYVGPNGNGDVVDDTGRVPVITTTSGSTTYYDVVAPNGTINNNGTRVRYTVTTAPVPVSTDFAQSDIYEWISSNLLTPVQSIQLPDGSEYSFTYDGYGELASMTLPTGGVIQYGYGNYVDSTYTANRWLTSWTVGSNPSMTFTPSAIINCENYSSGCVEQINVVKPSGDETVYQLTLNNGAWNTEISTYTGALGVLNVQSANVFNFGTSCPTSVCNGSEYITKSLETTTLPMYINGVATSLNTYEQSVYANPETSQLTALREWDYINHSSAPSAGSAPSSTPNRETDYAYAGWDIHSVTVLSNGALAGQTSYGYSTSATATSGLPQRGTLNAGGPYLQTITHWLNTGTSPVTTYWMDDSGQVLSTQDADQHPSSSVNYQCSNSLPNQMTNSLGQTITYGYDCNSGVITSMTDPNDTAAGRAGTTYAYDNAGRISTVTSPDSGVTAYAYPSSKEIDTTVTASPEPSITSASILDSFGRQYQTSQNGVTRETTYDANGRVETVTNPHASSSSPTDGWTTIDAYDGLDRPIQQISSGDTGGNWYYNGNLTTSYDGNNNQIQRTTNAFGQLTSVSEVLSPNYTYLTSNYSYDGLGNLVKISQVGNGSSDVPRVRTFTYDSMARMLCASYPENSTSTCPTSATSSYTAGTVGYGYDANGNLITKMAPAPSSSVGSGTVITTTLGYDYLNRITSKSYAGDLESTPWSCYQYDTAPTNGIGRLAVTWTQSGGCSASWSAASSSAVTATDILTYDPVGRITSQQECVLANCASSGTPFSLGYSYDLAGNRTATNLGALNGVAALSFTTPSTAGYDASGRLQQLVSNWVDSTHPASLFTADPTVGFTPPGGLQKATFGAGLLLQRTYDSSLRVTSETDTNP